MRGRVASWRLGTRIFVAQAVVLVAIVVTAGLVATFIGPPVFHSHLVESGHAENTVGLTHIERAFADASLISLAVGLLVALACALVITWFLARRTGRPVEQLTRAAAALSRGHYEARVDVDSGGPELALLGTTFNAMADRLANVENTRRRLLSDLAHEMRTPIATLNAHLEGMADGVLTWDANTRAVVEQQAERLTRLVRDLDEVSRAEEGRIVLEPSPQQVNDLVEPVLQQFQRSYAAKRVELTSTPCEAVVMADPQRIAQVLGNLLSNALRHTSAGGRVSVTCKRRNDEVTITVADTGEGMTDDQLAHIFERFYRGDHARQEEGGSGIGLTIARALAEAHGGRVVAYSAGVGLGSRFQLTLPSVGGSGE
ncbi:sensor histidine kinase [Propionibacteriaceae bacterium G1746]|uniref:sensor histidine kinase n=1 Tax=Aestuariimicrobium sp. G57 TaxID=3418485 RepID=UPI003C25DFC5